MAASPTATRAIDGPAFEEAARAAAAAHAPGADLSAMALVFTLIRAANRIVRDLETTVHRPAGLTWAGFRVLFTVWVAGPLAPMEIARLSSVSRASVSSVLNTLERDGLVVRRRVASDRRVVAVELTSRGRELVGEAFLEQNRREQAWAAALSHEERAELTALLGALVAHHPPKEER